VEVRCLMEFSILIGVLGRLAIFSQVLNVKLEFWGGWVFASGAFNFKLEFVLLVEFSILNYLDVILWGGLTCMFMIHDLSATI
jgi:hypothetical protein